MIKIKIIEGSVIINGPYNATLNQSNFITNHFTNKVTKTFTAPKSQVFNLPIKATNIITNVTEMIAVGEATNHNNNKRTNFVTNIVENIHTKTLTTAITNNNQVTYTIKWTNDWTNIYATNVKLDTKITTTLPSEISKTTLQDELNKIYQQGAVSWTVTDSGKQEVEFDTNKNSVLEDFDNQYYTNSNGNVTNITRGEYDELNNIAKDTSFDRNVFFVDMYTNSTRLGINPNFGRLIDVHPDRITGLTKFITVVAHELGHSLKLEHVNQVFPDILASFYGYTPTLPVIIAKKSGNLMISTVNGNLKILLKRQWDKINK